MKKIIPLLLVAYLVSNCNPGETGVDRSLIFPKLEVGKFWVYSIKENNIANGIASTSEYNLKEEILDTITFDKKPMFLIEISRKDKDSFDYKKIGTKLWYENPTGIYEKIGSSTIHKIKYPVYQNNEWFYDLSKGEAKENIVKYSSLNLSGKYINKEFTKGFKLQIRNDSTGLFKNKNIELYVPNVGLVISEIIDIDYCQETPSCIGKGQISSSKTTIKTLIEIN